ncbi:MAG: hypothetical protein ABSA77_04810 [Thermoguttaceae bacterium]
MRKPISSQSASGIVLFYPGRLLADQIHAWAQQYGGCRAAVSFERSLPGIRKWARRAALAVIDASSDPAQGTDAFLQSVSILTSDAVAVYTEKMHYGLEELVRMFGAPLLLGPMSMEEWEHFLEHKFPTLIPLDTSSLYVHRGKREKLQTVEEYEGNKVVYYRPNTG